jgi:hypothetical protein
MVIDWGGGALRFFVFAYTYVYMPIRSDPRGRRPRQEVENVFMLCTQSFYAYMFDRMHIYVKQAYIHVSLSAFVLK